MRDVDYTRVDDPAEAVAVLSRNPGARLLAGGTDLLNLLKEHIEEPGLLVDVSRTPPTGIAEEPDGLTLGALTTLADAAAHPAVRRGHPAVAQALESSASPQLRTMATLGGNLLQRTRCPYFRAETALPCNKRRPGTGCAARTGDHRSAAIFETGTACVATHPSDPAVALAALDTRLRLRGPRGERTLALADLYRMPGDPPHVETRLDHYEMITALHIPSSPLTAASRYVKVRERASYEFALVSAAVAAVVEDGVLTDVRIALGGVAPRPWRLHEAERALRGVEPRPAAVREAVAPAFAAARPLPRNAFKVELALRTVVRALTDVTDAPRAPQAPEGARR
ncbi:FAD binding domain-containing protein [Streptomyces sp. NPDC006134]|uniref:FAD binding domain-containing protein n=1 Tax=Streptomyces sp. NPDC006134 TaxID=3154467 RepID=UPI0033D5ABE1